MGAPACSICSSSRAPREGDIVDDGKATPCPDYARSNGSPPYTWQAPQLTGWRRGGWEGGLPSATF